MALTEAWPLFGLVCLPLLWLGVATTLADRPARMRYLSAAARSVALVLVVLALCRPTLDRPAPRAHVVFLVDVSASVDLDGVAAAADRIERAIDSLEGRDTYTLLAFGADVRRHEDVASLRELLRLWRAGAVDDRMRAETDLPAALTAASLSLPADAANRVVICSDGRPTTPDAEAALHALRDAGADVVWSDLRGLDKPELAVTSFRASPAFAHEGELVRFTAKLTSNRTGEAELRLTHRGVIVARRSVRLTGEAQEVVLQAPMVTPGRAVWTAQLAPSGSGQDFFAVNNAASVTVRVSGRPRVLVIHNQPREMRAFANALEQQEIAVETRPPAGAPGGLDGWLSYDAVVLADVAATDLSPQQMQMLRRYVADFGGGLAMLGSENSFGLGGYYRTPVEEVLPVSSRFEQEREKPSLAMVLVIDKSGSMSGMPMALARQAAKEAVELLGPRDQVAVVGFDGQPFVAVPMRSAADREAIKAAIDRIGAGGGTYLYAGMDTARPMLEGAPARIKHMIVLSDGMTQAADHTGLTVALADAGVTVSTVALGAGADRGLLAHIAEIGGGRYYETLDPESVPQIFTRETMQASRSAIKEDLFSSLQVGDHPLMTGYADAELPFTLGYVATRARPTARVLLATDRGEPLLAINPFGLGQGLAFTGDLTPRWGAEWLSWSGFGKFWAQAMRALIRRPNTGDTSMRVDADARRLRVTLTEPPASVVGGTPSAWQAEAIDDQGRATPVEVHPTGVGRFEAAAALGRGSRMSLRVFDPATGRLHAVEHERPYPSEYLLDGARDPALTRLPGFDPAAVRAGLPSAVAARPLMPWLLLLAVVSCIASVVLRRV